jgi:type I restriction enzyme M protein
MDAAEYKHVVLGLIFLKYISDAFEEHRKKLLAEPYADPEDPDEYRAENIFWVPPEAWWSELQKNARQPSIGELVDRAMEAVERDNPSLKGVLPKDYARPALDKTRLGQLIDLISNLHLGGQREPRPGYSRSRLRVLPRAVRERRGKEGRGVLHAPLHRQAPGGDAPPI